MRTPHPAERAIDQVVKEVERAILDQGTAGADVRLIDAVVLLKAARQSVADFVDGVESRRVVTSPNLPDLLGYSLGVIKVAVAGLRAGDVGTTVLADMLDEARVRLEQSGDGRSV